MEEEFIVAAVRVGKALRFYPGRAGQQALYEQALQQQGLSVLVWGKGASEEAAMHSAMMQAAVLRISEQAG